MVKRDHEAASRVAGGLATQAADRIVQAGGDTLELMVPGGAKYVARVLSGPGGTKAVELRREGVLIDSRVLGNASKRLLDARRSFLVEFEDLMRMMPQLIQSARQRHTAELIGRSQRRTDKDVVASALEAARRHGIDAGS